MKQEFPYLFQRGAKIVEDYANLASQAVEALQKSQNVLKTEVLAQEKQLFEVSRNFEALKALVDTFLTVDETDIEQKNELAKQLWEPKRDIQTQ